MSVDITFSQLISTIQNVSSELTTQASKAVNISLTLRNWLIGYYISEYELHGKDRAVYGDNLFKDLAKSLKSISNCNKRQLYRYKKFYTYYKQKVGALPPQFKSLTIFDDNQKVGALPPLFQNDTNQLITKLSYTHFDELVNIEDETKRQFYEVESIKGVWSSRELKRQIASLYYERSGLSTDKNKLSELAHKNSEVATSLNIKDPYIFEFLGLTPTEVMSENHLETQLSNKLQDFLMELGHGFCFEARQKRILIGEEHFFVDLVFYHRILKCHVLIELKLENFSHENLGQLNTYVNWYKKNIMAEGDNPPIGMLLCTDKNHALVEYALAGMDNSLFVSKYQLELPKKEEMQKFIDEQLKGAGNR